MLDFDALRAKQVTINDLTQGLTIQDLHNLIDEMIDTELEIITSATDADVVFVPADPAANDTFAASDADVHISWTLGHVIVHAMATSEEGAFLAAEMARGVAPHGRSRYETAWETVTTIAQCRARIEESRRMRHAMLNVWPDEPHLDVTFSFENRPEVSAFNAYGRFIYGLSHEQSHLEQLREIMRQAVTARQAAS